MEADELSMMLGEMRSDIKSILRGQDSMKRWQDSHDKKDTDRFERIHERIDGINKYAASIAIVAGGIGVCSTWVWHKLTGS